MTKWYRMNPYLGCIYEIPEKLALRKIRSRTWMQQYDHDRGELSDVWINLKDMHRDLIFKVEVKTYDT